MVFRRNLIKAGVFGIGTGSGMAYSKGNYEMSHPEVYYGVYPNGRVKVIDEREDEFIKRATKLENVIIKGN